MADTPTNETPASVRAFNEKVAELLKSAHPDDLVHILKSDKSLVAAGNQNINGKSPA